MNVCDLGVCEYKEALKLQEDLLNKRIKREAPDTLIIVEHSPVVTLGRTAEKSNVIDKSFFEENNIPVVFTGRGGKNTYHAPGQLVLYPIIDLGEKKKDISLYIDFLEKTVTKSLRLLGVQAERIPEKRGIWAGGRKIAFIGIAIRRWVTFHGVAVNINNDITPFSHMHPCGESDINVTSAAECAGHEIDMCEVKKIFTEQFIKDLEVEYGAPVEVTGIRS